MNCPRCAEPLQDRTLAGIQIESCPGCRGMFLEHGTLDRIAEPHEGDLEFSTLDGDSFSHEDTHGPTGCPRCAGAPTMKKAEFNIYTGIILDYCETCRAFWLDGTELDRINEEVRRLNDASKDDRDPPMLWFARFIWGLPR